VFEGSNNLSDREGARVSKKRMIRITLETERVIWLRQRRGCAPLWCAGCGDGTRMMSADEAALLTRISTRTIYRWIEADRIHFTGTPDGLLMVCLKSLYDLKESTDI
jgi:excisionase family DNA binding protein